jgi:hypothetical protein
MPDFNPEGGVQRTSLEAQPPSLLPQPPPPPPPPQQQQQPQQQPQQPQQESLQVVHPVVVDMGSDDGAIKAKILSGLKVAGSCPMFAVSKV